MVHMETFPLLNFPTVLIQLPSFGFVIKVAMLNLKRPGCLFLLYRVNSGHKIDINIYYLYVNSKGLDTKACAESVDRNTDPAINQTSGGGLSVKYQSKTQCAVPNTDSRLQIDIYIGLTTN